MKFEMPKFVIGYDKNIESIKIVENISSVILNSYLDLKDQKIIEKLAELGYHKLSNKEWQLIQTKRNQE